MWQWGLVAESLVCVSLYVFLLSFYFSITVSLVYLLLCLLLWFYELPVSFYLCVSFAFPPFLLPSLCLLSLWSVSSLKGGWMCAIEHVDQIWFGTQVTEANEVTLAVFLRRFSHCSIRFLFCVSSCTWWNVLFVYCECEKKANCHLFSEPKSN